jgi:hypothetical protein
VFSIGVKYASTWNTVVRFSERQNWLVSLEADAMRLHGEHSIADLLILFKGLSPEQMADDLFGNKQRTSSRSGILKSEAVQQFASALDNAGIHSFSDLNEGRLAIAEALVREIPGQASGISFDYFQMLAGDDNLIKPDRMVQRYIAKALGVAPQQVAPELARALMQGAVQTLNARGKNWTPRKLDYAIWNAQSSGANG